MENEKFEDSLGVNERIRRLKHWLVFITFGVPMLFTLLNILIWVIFEVDTNCKRNLNHFLLSFPALKMDWHLYESDFHSIDLVFNCAHRRYVKKQITKNIFLVEQQFNIDFNIFSTGSMLVFVEAYGEGVKACKYYSCATLFVYESIWFVSIVNLAYTLMNTWSIEEYIMELQDMPHCKPTFLVSIAKLFYVLTCGFAFFLHWMKNTFAHVSLCQSRFFEVRENCDRKSCCIVLNRKIMSFHFLFTASSKEDSKRLQSPIDVVHWIFSTNILCGIVIDTDCSL